MADVLGWQKCGRVGSHAREGNGSGHADGGRFVIRDHDGAEGLAGNRVGVGLKFPGAVCSPGFTHETVEKTESFSEESLTHSMWEKTMSNVLGLMKQAAALRMTCKNAESAEEETDCDLLHPAVRAQTA